MAGAELEIPPDTVAEEEQEKVGEESTNKGEEERDKAADKQEENEEDEESTYEAEDNDDSDHTQVPEDDEHTEVADEVVIADTPAAGKEGQEEDKKGEDGQENVAGEEAANLEEETKAATVLQSNFRGHKERKRLQEEGKIPAKKQREKSPTSEEEVPPASSPTAEETSSEEKGKEENEESTETQEEAEASSSNVKTEDLDETKAAVVLQSNFRGHKERKRLEEEGKIPKKRKRGEGVTPEPPKEEEEGMPTEDSVPESQQDASAENLDGLDEEKAATVLQSNFRGHRDRKKLKAEREAQQKVKEEAANDAEEESKEKEKEEEVLDVTDVVIEHKEEADAEKERLEEEQAAVKIQSNFRGYKDRKNLKANKQTAKKEAEQLQTFSKQVIPSRHILLHPVTSPTCHFFLIHTLFLSNLFQQIAKTSQEFVALQQKLNEIIQAHQSNPESNGMLFVRGKAINGYAPKNHQSSKISEIGSVKNKF